MVRILIGEPADDVRELLVHQLRRLGHEPVALEGAVPPDELPDLFLFEPDSPELLELARALRARAADLPIVVCSIHPPLPETKALAPVHHLQKPFHGSELAAAVSLGSAAP